MSLNYNAGQVAANGDVFKVIGVTIEEANVHETKFEDDCSKTFGGNDKITVFVEDNENKRHVFFFDGTDESYDYCHFDENPDAAKEIQIFATKDIYVQLKEYDDCRDGAYLQIVGTDEELVALTDIDEWDEGYSNRWRNVYSYENFLTEESA